MLISVLPLGLLLALVLLLARLLAVTLLMPQSSISWHERLVVTGCGLGTAVPLALAVSMTEELPHLRGIPTELAEPLAVQLMALIFVVGLSELLLQTFLMRRLCRSSLS